MRPLNTSLDSADQHKSAGVVSSFKTGFGSLLSVFKDDAKKKPKALNQSLDESLTAADRLSQSHVMESGSHLESAFGPAFLQHFQSAEEIYKYLIQVGSAIMNQREKIAQLFKQLQDAFADLFFGFRLLYQETRDLELLKDFFKLRVEYLKQQNTGLQRDKEEFERVWRRERDEREALARRVEVAERRLVEAAQEVGSHRLKSAAFEEEVRQLRRRLFSLEQDREEARDKAGLEVSRLQRRLEQASEERDSLKAAIAEYGKYINGVFMTNY